MSQGLCLLIDVLDTDTGSAQADGHLATATRALGDDLVFARVLAGVGGSPDIAVVGASEPGALGRFAAAPPPPGGRRVVCGVNPSVVTDGADPAPAGYLELVLARKDPPIPFDDPTVVGVSRDYFARYLPMLGSRHLRCEVLWHDDDRVRAAGGFIAFRAEDDDEALWWAGGDPWRRVAPGYLVRLPEGLLRAPHPVRRRPARRPRCGT